MMVQPAPNTEALDAYLKDIVQTLHKAVNTAMRQLDSDPPAVERVIQDCKEILDHIMEGKVEDWVN